MSSAPRPKLVQEGSSLAAVSSGGSSLQAVSSQSKSKFRLVIGGEDEDEPLPDDPDQMHGYNRYEGHNNYRGGGRGYRGGGRLNYYGGRGRYNNHYRGGGRGRGGYRGGGRDYNNHHYGGGGRGYNDHHHHSNHYEHGGYDNRYDGGGGGGGYDNNHRYDNGYNNEYHDNGGGGGYDPRYHNDQPHRKIIKNPKAPGLINSRIVIGDNSNDDDQQTSDAGINMDIEDIIPQTYNEELHQIERMEGVISLDAKEPLVVMDGANVAYAYADAMQAASSGGGKREPDYRGLQVAANHFMEAGVRVLIVLPAPWFRVKPAAGDVNRDNALMLTEKVEALKDLKEQGLLVAAPPRDDDDAYALTIARREQTRAQQRGEGGGFVLSNDMFRDAMARDPDLEQWLKGEWGRISFAFCDLGTVNDYGQRELDFIPNPRHPLVSDVDRQRHAAQQQEPDV